MWLIYNILSYYLLGFINGNAIITILLQKKNLIYSLQKNLIKYQLTETLLLYCNFITQISGVEDGKSKSTLSTLCVGLFLIFRQCIEQDVVEEELRQIED